MLALVTTPKMENIIIGKLSDMVPDPALADFMFKQPVIMFEQIGKTPEGKMNLLRYWAGEPTEECAGILKLIAAFLKTDIAEANIDEFQLVFDGSIELQTKDDEPIITNAETEDDEDVKPNRIFGNFDAFDLRLDENNNVVYSLEYPRLSSYRTPAAYNKIHTRYEQLHKELTEAKEKALKKAAEEQSAGTDDKKSNKNAGKK